MAKDLDVSMTEVVAETVEEEVDEVEEDTSKEFVEGAAANMKMELISKMSHVALKIQSGPHSQTIQVKVSMSNRYTQSFWQIKRGAPPYMSVLKKKTTNG